MVVMMKKLNNISALLMVCLVVTISGCTAFPRIYSGESIHGWVIDSKTRQPIKDVVVVEIWELEGGWHTDHTANIHIAETVTDEEGYYTFPDWGPRFTTDGSLSRSSPKLVFYKFGYEVARRRNTITGNMHPDNSVSEHSGEKIELVKFHGTPREYYDLFNSVEQIIKASHYRSAFDCVWEKIPRFTAEVVYLRECISNQRSAYAIKKYPSSFLDNLSDPGCEKPREILKDYLK